MSSDRTDMTRSDVAAAIVGIQQSVARGAALLDKKLPGWRMVMKKQKDWFNIGQEEFCVLGTLEHFHGKLKALKVPARAKHEMPGYWTARAKLGFATFVTPDLQNGRKDDVYYGFNTRSNDVLTPTVQQNLLNAMWRQEFR